MMPGVYYSAEISECGKYRYELVRTWDVKLPNVGRSRDGWSAAEQMARDAAGEIKG